VARDRDSTAADLETGPADRAFTKDLRWAMVCSRCHVDVLAYCTDRFQPRLAEAAGLHNTERPGHDARVVPRHPDELPALLVPAEHLAAVRAGALAELAAEIDEHGGCPDAGCSPDCPARIVPEVAPAPSRGEVPMPEPLAPQADDWDDGPPAPLDDAAAALAAVVDAGERPPWAT
jgi:hypothetical protein